MEYYVIGCLIILIIASIRRKKYLLTPVAIFSGMWVFVLFLTSLRLYGMVEYSEKAIWLILLSNVFFFLGNMPNRAITARIKKRINSKSTLYEEHYAINMTVVYGCIIIAILCLLVFGLQVIRLLRSGVVYSRIRDMLFGYGNTGKIIENGVFMNFFQWVIVGIVNALMPICLIELFDENEHKVMIVAGLSIAMIYTLATAGRITIFILIIYITILLYHYNKKIPRKIKKRAVFAIAIVGSVLLWITNLREGYNIGKQVSSSYAYFTIPIPLLSHWLEYVDSTGVHTFGLSLIYGVIEFVQWGLHALDIVIPGLDGIREVINAPQNTWVTIFTNPHGWYNAFCSAIYFWYLDFGIIGVAIIPFLMGILSNNVFLKVQKKKSKKSLFYYLIIVQLLVTCFLRFQTITPSFFISLLIVALAVKDKHKSVNELDKVRKKRMKVLR